MSALTPSVNPDEVTCTAVRAQGAGGQNVNKVSSAIHLRFDVPASTLPDDIKERLLALSDGRITAEGVIVIKAQTTRSQEQNKADALARLQALVDSVATPPAPRRATKVPKRAKAERLLEKSTRSAVKQQRSRVSTGD